MIWYHINYKYIYIYIYLFVYITCLMYVWYLSVQEVQKENSLEKVCYQTFWSNLDLHFSSATVGPISIESSVLKLGVERSWR